jgi:hypothetical protein
MNLSQFFDTYRAQVRVMLNWARLQELQCDVECLEVRLPDSASIIYAPWYARPDGSVCGYANRTAIPQSLLDVSLNSALCSHHEVRSEFVGVTDFAVPAYLLPDRKFLLLDGNHRAVSAVLARIEAEVKIHALTGPIAPEMLPDLQHWVSCSGCMA